MRVALDSSVLVWADYSDDATLDVQFHSGKRYRYCDVPRTVFDALVVAESKGKFFNSEIRDCYRYEPLA